MVDTKNLAGSSWDVISWITGSFKLMKFEDYSLFSYTFVGKGNPRNSRTIIPHEQSNLKYV